MFRNDVPFSRHESRTHTAFTAHFVRSIHVHIVYSCWAGLTLRTTPFSQDDVTPHLITLSMTEVIMCSCVQQQLGLASLAFSVFPSGAAEALQWVVAWGVFLQGRDKKHYWISWDPM